MNNDARLRGNKRTEMVDATGAKWSKLSDLKTRDELITGCSANAAKDAPVREGVPAQAIALIGRGEQGLLVRPPPPTGRRQVSAATAAPK